jgi:glycosyltransferase involved in cell wall biosynthesis
MTARLWFATELYYPEATSTAYILTKLAESLAKWGPVGVLCAQPNYELKGRTAPRVETVNGVKVFRVSHPKLDRAGILRRLVNLVVVTVQLFARALLQFRKGDVVVVVTNPPALPFAILFAAKVRGVVTVLLVHDVYPDAAVISGLVRADGFVVRLWRGANGWLLRHADRVVVLGRDARELVCTSLRGHVEKVQVIENWADSDSILPASIHENELVRELGLEGRFILGYAGNIGRVHDIRTLLDAAERLRIDCPDVQMVFVGSGAKEADVRVASSQPGSNVTFVGPLPRERQQVFLNACHVSILAMAPGMAGVGVPSRLYNALAAGRPLIVVADKESEPARVISEEGAGLQVDPGDVPSLVAAIRKLKSDPIALVEAGRQARRAAVKRFSLSNAVTSYRALLGGLGWPCR